MVHNSYTQIIKLEIFHRVDRSKEWTKRVNRRANIVEEIPFGLKDYQTVKVCSPNSYCVPYSGKVWWRKNLANHP